MMVKREENHRSQRFRDKGDSRAGVCGTTLLSGTAQHACAYAGKTSPRTLPVNLGKNQAVILSMNVTKASAVTLFPRFSSGNEDSRELDAEGSIHSALSELHRVLFSS